MLYMVVCKVEEHGNKTVGSYYWDPALQMTLGYFGDNAEKLF